MANHKPPRTHTDIEVLAARWHTEWTPHDGIDPWLRRHLTELTALVRDDRWSWDDLARALSEAGILYATGRPWSGQGLCDKVSKLRVRQRRAAVASNPHDVIATVREALGATAGNFNTININLTAALATPSARTPAPEHHPSTGRVPAPAPTVARPSASTAEPKFRPARLRNDGRGVSVEERRALGDPTVPADPDDSQ